FVFAPAIGQSLGSSTITLGLQFFSIAVGTSIGSTLIASIFQGYEDVTPNALFIQIVNPALFVAFLAVDLVVPPLGITTTDALLAYALANAITLGLLVLYLVRRLPRRLPSGPRAPPLRAVRGASFRGRSDGNYHGHWRHHCPRHLSCRGSRDVLGVADALPLAPDRDHRGVVHLPPRREPFP